MSSAATERHRAAREAAGLALLAAFVWATYYFFVLRLNAEGVGDAPVLSYSFLSGGVAYLLLVLGTGGRVDLGRAFRSPGSYARVGILIAMQLSVIVATYGIGAVDTSLLTLVGDVVVTPVLVVLLFREGRDRFGSPFFLLGILVSTTGAALAIAAGGATRAISGPAGVVALVLPFLIAAYFVATARAGRTTPSAPLVAQATITAAILTLLLAPLLPGGVGALIALDPLQAVLLAINGVLSFFVGPWLYFRAIRRAGLLLPSVLMATIPVFTLLLAGVLLGSLPPLLGAIGVPIASIGAYLAFRGESRLPGEGETPSPPGTRAG